MEIGFGSHTYVNSLLQSDYDSVLNNCRTIDANIGFFVADSLHLIRWQVQYLRTLNNEIKTVASYCCYFNTYIKRIIDVD